MFVLDTDHISLLKSASDEGRRIRDRLRTLSLEPVVATIISYEEQSRGWLAYKARANTLLQEVEAYAKLKGHLKAYQAIQLLDFDQSAATHFQWLRKSRIRIGTMDLKIASIALANGATLLSRNLGDFGKVPGLQVEDWTA